MCVNFNGATGTQTRKSIKDHAFAVFNGTFAFLFDGAGSVPSAAKQCVDDYPRRTQRSLWSLWKVTRSISRVMSSVTVRSTPI
jgi:hypothetical protein